MELTYTSSNISDIEYYNLARQSYKSGLEIDDKVRIKGRDVTWSIVKTMDNSKNGAQGIALAPVLPDGKIDKSQIIIAYRGTLPQHLDGDITADILQIGLNIPIIPTDIKTPVGNIRTYTTQTQFKSALEFSDDISNSDEYKNAKISYTGHSLGGALAQYVAAERNREATTFAAPNAYGLLSKDAKSRVDEGKTRNSIRDYLHENDILGAFAGGDPLIGKQYYTASNEKALTSWGNPIAGHGIDTYTGKFNNEDGSIEFRMEPEAMIARVKAFRPHLELIKDWRRTIKHYIEDEAHAVRKIYQDMLANVNGSGKYPLLSEHDVTDFFKEKAMTVKGSDYYFIDVDMAMDLCQKLNKFEHQMELFLEDLIKAAETTGSLDKEISQWFGGKR